MGCFLVDDYWTPILQSAPKWAPRFSTLELPVGLKTTVEILLGWLVFCPEAM